MSNPESITDGVVERAALAAARRIAPEQPGVDVDVQAALHARGEQQQPAQYFDPVTLGSLIVSVATLTWTVYKDLRTKAHKPSASTVERRVRIQLETSHPVTATERDKIIETVVEEILKEAD